VHGNFIRPRVQFVVEGEPAHFKCSNLSHTIWYYESSASTPKSSSILSDNNELKLLLVENHEMGKYFCLGYNRFQDLYISVARLYVLGQILNWQ